MVEGPWTIFHKFKEYIADGTIDMDGDTFRVTLHTNASNLTANLVSTVTILGSVTGELAEAGGYSTSGKTLSAPTWAAGASSGEMRFDATAVFFSATANISNIQWALIHVDGASAGDSFLVAYSKLSTTQFDLTNTNRLTITPSANGLFELN